MNLSTTQPSTMTSLQIAEIAGKQHRHVLASIRKMEEAWHKVTGSKFRLSEYTDSTGRVLPCYNLTKEECLYIATKFNDEARARLVLRWLELERNQQKNAMTRPNDNITELRQICTLQAQNIELHEEMDKMRANAESMKESYEKALNVFGAAFSMLPNLATTSDISNRYGMTARQLNDKLEEAGIIHRSGGNVYLTEEYAGKGIAVDYTYHEDEEKTNNYLRWTKPGQTFLFLLVKFGYDVEYVWDMFDKGQRIIILPKQ